MNLNLLALPYSRSPLDPTWIWANWPYPTQEPPWCRVGFTTYLAVDGLLMYEFLGNPGHFGQFQTKAMVDISIVTSPDNFVVMPHTWLLMFFLFKLCSSKCIYDKFEKALQSQTQQLGLAPNQKLVVAFGLLECTQEQRVFGLDQIKTSYYLFQQTVQMFCRCHVTEANEACNQEEI